MRCGKRAVPCRVADDADDDDDDDDDDGSRKNLICVRTNGESTRSSKSASSRLGPSGHVEIFAEKGKRQVFSE